MERIFEGPQWAWDIVWGTLELDTKSIGFDLTLRREILAAVSAITDVEQEVTS